MAKLNLEVKLIGEDGNIFNLMGIVSREMKRNGYQNQIKEFTDDITSSNSYDEALAKIMDWVNIK